MHSGCAQVCDGEPGAAVGKWRPRDPAGVVAHGDGETSTGSVLAAAQLPIT